MDKRRIVSKLSSHRSDLTDDSRDIYDINHSVDDLIYDFELSVKSDNTGNIADKIGNLREGSQSSDTNISRAVSYIDYEIDTLNREIREEEEAEARRRAAASKSGSGGF